MKATEDDCRDVSALSEGLGPLPEPDFLLDNGRLRCYYAGSVTKLLAAQREQMIADGWRQTRYLAPVTDCEACLTPDACAIRGQCWHYLRERA